MWCGVLIGIAIQLVTSVFVIKVRKERERESYWNTNNPYRTSLLCQSWERCDYHSSEPFFVRNSFVLKCFTLDRVATVCSSLLLITFLKCHSSLTKNNFNKKKGIWFYTQTFVEPFSWEPTALCTSLVLTSKVRVHVVELCQNSFLIINYYRLECERSLF